MYKGVGSLCCVYLTFLKYHMKMKQFDLAETKLLHFHKIFKNGGGEEIWIRLCTKESTKCSVVTKLVCEKGTFHSFKKLF